MFGMDLFKLAGINLPGAEPGYDWVIQVVYENDPPGLPHETHHADLKEAASDILEILKAGRDITHISASRRHV